jgi:ankyrin repeat protein
MLHKEWIEYLKRNNETSNNFKNYYMSRKLRRFIQIDRKLLETNKDDQFIIVHTKKEFNEKCSQKLKNVHYLIQDQSNPNHHFVWQNSNGPISTLKKYVITNKECEELIDEEEIFHKNNEKVLIISAEPGMGKSLILDNFTQYSSAENFFVKIILNTCKETLSATNFKENLSKDLIEFVLKSLLNKTNEQEISLLKHLAKEEKLILLFDGLDEVNDYKEQVIQLIDALIKDKRIKRILITTRNQLREELEDLFRTFSFNLNNFDDKDQKNFLHKYWRNLNLKNQARPTSASKFMQSAEDLIKRIKSINLIELIGIPLQTKMLADIYFEKVKNEEEFSKLILTNIADLYNQFIESKIEIQFERTNNNTKIASLSRKFKEYFEDSKQKFYSNHIKLSSLILFEQNNQKEIGLELNEQDILEYGVIVAFTVNKMPTFLHQSFAEFFLAKSCLQKIKEQKRIKDDKELEQILRDKRHFLIRKFLNDLIMGISEYQKEQQKEAKEDLKQEIENCCRENLVSLLKYFIEDQGAKLNTKNEFLSVASKNGHKDIVAFLLKKGIDINQTDNEYGWTALMLASKEGHVEIVKLLLAKENIEINQEDKYGKTALMWASEYGHVEIVKLLLAKENIEINQEDKYGKTALMWASEYGHVEIVKLLLAKENIKINHKDEFGQTALMYASKEGHVEIVKLLLAKENIEINQTYEGGWTALMEASEKGHVEIVKLLLAKENIEINQTYEGGWTALMEASEKGHVEIVKLLLAKENIEINQTTKWGNTALILESEQGHVEIVKMLLDKDNITINHKDKWGKTALMWASREGHVEIVKLLLAKENIEINQQDKYGWTALIWASSQGHVEIVKLLLAKENIEINQEDKYGWTALMLVSSQGHVEIVKLLLAKENIEINQQDEDGNTALKWASENGHVEIVKMLEAKGKRD